jgi:hypothetical protein
MKIRSKTMKLIMPFAALALGSALAVSACGTTTSDRALSGAGIGALGGAAIGSVTGSAGKGALIGGALGAAAGALIPPEQANLGDPVWRRNHHCVEYFPDGSCHYYAAN